MWIWQTLMYNTHWQIRNPDQDISPWIVRSILVRLPVRNRSTKLKVIRWFDVEPAAICKGYQPRSWREIDSPEALHEDLNPKPVDYKPSVIIIYTKLLLQPSIFTSFVRMDVRGLNMLTLDIVNTGLTEWHSYLACWFVSRRTLSR